MKIETPNHRSDLWTARQHQIEEEGGRFISPNKHPLQHPKAQEN